MSYQEKEGDKRIISSMSSTEYFTKLLNDLPITKGDKDFLIEEFLRAREEGFKAGISKISKLLQKKRDEIMDFGTGGGIHSLPFPCRDRILELNEVLGMLDKLITKEIKESEDE